MQPMALICFTSSMPSMSSMSYVMSSRPGEIKDIVTVPFSRPRDFDVVGVDSFVRLKTQLLSAMRGT